MSSELPPKKASPFQKEGLCPWANWPVACLQVISISKFRMKLKEMQIIPWASPTPFLIFTVWEESTQMYNDKFKGGGGGYPNIGSCDSMAGFVTSKLLLFQETKFCSWKTKQLSGITSLIFEKGCVIQASHSPQKTMLVDSRGHQSPVLCML